MWFKQLQLFQLTDSLHMPVATLIEKLETLAFKPCFPSMFSSMGWVPPVDEIDSPLARVMHNCIMLCLQIEEKILPAAVIRHELYEKIKTIELMENRKVYQQEKLSLKDEIILTLLPRAFSKFTKLYGYVDTRYQWLVLDTHNAKKAEQFIVMFKKSVTEKIHPFELKKIAPTMTQWLKNQDYSSAFSIEKACVLQDPNQQNRIIRCQQQNLFAASIQALIQEGCEAKQLALSWQDRVNFVLTDQFMLSSIKYQDEITAQAGEMEAETKQQQFDVDFLIMLETLTSLLKDLFSLFKCHLDIKQHGEIHEYS